MTLNLTLLHPTYVMQVSDRLVTDKVSGAEFDGLANKNVVYLARDGVFSICYSGPAYVEHVPTDTWIACKLAGEDPAPLKSGKGLRDGRVGIKIGGTPKEPWLDIGQSVELLRRELERVNLANGIDVAVAGWQKNKGGMRPICWGIEARRRTATAENPLPRYWHYEKSASGGHCYHVLEIPGWLSLPKLRELAGLLTREAWSPEAAVQRLIWAVRCVAERRRAVGPHCMCILLPNPDVRAELFVRYEPVTEARATITSGEDGVDVPAAFTPWFVGPTIHCPPSIIVGGHMPPPQNQRTTPPHVPGSLALRFSLFAILLLATRGGIA